LSRESTPGIEKVAFTSEVLQDLGSNDILPEPTCRRVAIYNVHAFILRPFICVRAYSVTVCALPVSLSNAVLAFCLFVKFSDCSRIVCNEENTHARTHTRNAHILTILTCNYMMHLTFTLVRL
jgi:hypothetical protein